MCELFALSSKHPTRVRFSLNLFAQHGGDTGPHKDGWGFAYYQGNETWRIKAAEPAAFSDTLKFVADHAPASSMMLSHIRLATHGEVNLANTQPFSFPLRGKRVTFAHNGHVPSLADRPLEQHYQPVGNTDSEGVFSALLSELSTLPDTDDEVAFNLLESFLISLAEAGPLNLIFADSERLFAFSNKRTQADKSVSAPGMHFLCRQCSAIDELKLSGIEIPEGQQELVLFASVPLSQEHWQPMLPNRLYVARSGRLIRQA